MKEYRSLAWPFYLAGLALIVLPAVELVLTVAPLSPGVLSWRYGAVGLLSRSLAMPIAGVLVIFGTAVLLEHGWIRRAAWILGFVGAAALVAVAGVFVLDVLQFRHQVRPQALAAYEAASAVAGLKLLAGTVVLLAMGISGVGMSRRAAGHRRRTGPVPLIARAEHEEEPTPAP